MTTEKPKKLVTRIEIYAAYKAIIKGLGAFLYTHQEKTPRN